MSEENDSLTAKGVPPGKMTLVEKIEPGNLAHETNAARYDNPRGYPGLAGLQMHRRKGERLIDHDILHKMEQEGDLARTGDPEARPNPSRARAERREPARLAGRSVADF